MTINKVLFVLAVCLAALLSASGCSNPVSALRSGNAPDTAEAETADSGALKRVAQPKRNAATDAGDLADLSPEASIRQGLARLMEKEREQEQNLAEMRQALSEGNQVVAREEQRLLSLQRQREEYEVALATYGQPRPAGRPVGTQTAAAPRRGGARNLALEAGGGAPLADGERMIYNPLTDNPPSRAGGWNIDMAGPELAAAPDRPVQRRPSELDDDIQWNPPVRRPQPVHLAAAQPAAAEPPTASASVRPAAAPAPRQAAPPQRAGSQPAPAVATARTVTQPEYDAPTDPARLGEVFVPDLVLGGA